MNWLRSKLPRKRWKRVALYVFSTFCVALAGDMGLTRYWRMIDVSPETTYVTAPLNAAGTPDYVAMINERAGRGMTLENNAAPLLYRVLGTQGTGYLYTESYPREYQKWREGVLPALGLPAEGLPKKFSYFAEWAQEQHGGTGQSTDGTAPAPSTNAQLEQLFKEEDDIPRNPWKAADHPLWAQWLDSQKESLELTHQAANRSRYYTPVSDMTPTDEPGGLPQVRLTSLYCFLQLANFIVSDAQRRAGEGDVAAFHREVIDVMKFGGLLSQSRVLVEDAVGWKIYRLGCQTVTSAAGQPGFLSTKDTRTLFTAMDMVPPMGDVDFILERCVDLDICCYAARFGLAHGLFGESAQPKLAPVIALVVPVRMNAAMRDINDIFNRLDESVRLPTYRGRIEAVNAWQRKLNGGTGAYIAKWAGLEQVWNLDDLWMAKICAARQAALTQRDLTRVALALLDYKLAHGEYPEALAALVAPGGLLKEVPGDGFADAPLKYRREGAGYVLYSVGKDEKDDGGDEEKDQVVRMKG